MTEADVCNGERFRFDTDTLNIMKRALSEQPAVAGQPIIRSSASMQELCSDTQLLSYLAVSQYKVHPCKDFRAQIAYHSYCEAFTVSLPPAYEDVQATSFARRFVGAALLPDIIHHVYNGDWSALLSDTKQQLR